MKRNAWVLFFISVLVLAAVTGCSQDEDQFRGEWTRINDDDPICPSALKFYENGLLTLVIDHGMDYTGTIKKMENDNYAFDLKVETRVIQLKLQEDQTVFLSRDGKEKCIYKKKQ
ncbi:hypothetical protein [Staphylospora marina]|uniref:hypothetical protein n=1 Tax=Staphylospora marina TaxID=2490858 RepID=UPI000F5BF018|nr:hypothetical protein [Staphylospora marina]